MGKKQDSLLKATEVCGWTKGHKRHIQTWWWNEEVGAVIEIKKVKFREWQKAKASPEEVKLKEYVEARKEAKKAVAKAQQKKKGKVWRKTGYKRTKICI